MTPKGDQRMPRAKRTPLSPVEREKRTIVRLTAQLEIAKRRQEQLLTDLRDTMKDRDHVRSLNERRGDQVADLCRDLRMTSRQLSYMHDLYRAMLQRYVGTKLDTQQFTFPQAQQFIENEARALDAALTAIHDQVLAEQQREECVMAPAAQAEAA